MADARELLRRYCQDSDQSGFSEFYGQESGRLWRYLRARGCSRDGAYDLLAESFLRFIQVVCRDLRAPVALLYRIAINLHIDGHRRAAASPVVSMDADADERPDESAQISDEQDYVRALLETLSEDEQNMLLLRYWIGLNHREVAETMNLPEGTVRRRCAAAIQQLRVRWQEDSRGG
ncbi:MAG: RNA polymerase sigma factor [Gammaproteobacteria bacterium]|nr:RNA polymerase sigma factor [Gammaproteobacteria bacterium]